MWFTAFFSSRAFGLNYPKTATMAFTAAGNNFELAIAVCIGVWGVTSGQALAGTIGPSSRCPRSSPWSTCPSGFANDCSPRPHHNYGDSMSSAKPSVLFVCVHNAGRSQMAAACLTHLAGDRVEVRSAGSAPADTVNPAVVQALAEEGIDISAEVPKVLTTEAVRSPTWSSRWAAATPARSSREALRGLETRRPAGQGVDAVRPIRDDIRTRIEALIAEIAPAAGIDEEGTI